MSNNVSVLVYSRKVGSPIRKAVLVYFAERASDNGEGVWASKPTIAAAIECGRSTVIRTINDFLREGILSEVGKRPCRNGETIEYAMNLDAIAAMPAAIERGNIKPTSPTAGPVPQRDPSQSGTPPVPQRDPYPSRSGTQTIIGTTIEPPIERDAAKTPDEIILDAVALFDPAFDEAVASFIAYRRKSKAGAMTATAAKRLGSSLRQILEQGGDPSEAIGMAEERGWRTIKPEWYFREANGNDRPSKQDTMLRASENAARAFAAGIFGGR